MPTPREDSRSTEFIGPLKNEHMKTHCKRDASGRVEVLYEAPVHVQHNESCLATLYDYGGTSASVPTNTLEKVAQWNSAWDVDDTVILVYGDIGYTE